MAGEVNCRTVAVAASEAATVTRKVSCTAMAPARVKNSRERTSRREVKIVSSFPRSRIAPTVSNRLPASPMRSIVTVAGELWVVSSRYWALTPVLPHSMAAIITDIVPSWRSRVSVINGISCGVTAVIKARLKKSSRVRQLTPVQAPALNILCA